MWMEEDAGQRVSEVRVSQLLEKAPEVIVVNCPYCLTMLEDGLKGVDGSEAPRVLDLAEMVAARLDSEPGSDGGGRSVSPVAEGKRHELEEQQSVEDAAEILDATTDRRIDNGAV